ncbi:MerR family transcriptional regulator [Sphingobacterium siyangense]|uniref:MerR family mercuric resistance operon transcriptional regulator/MerR family Zn(II)-responsive transcriptional regulator of zntA n=1 Tax=Sphingobacterium siyangense TaxID=459529 RepID=A0A562MTN0_9SPHI|nr:MULTISPECIES: MerR family transcriptional regulator [Sphingobacterium]TWI22951.1 MerR family mercuric resistance operon transcriptional regulator/MerR family Zn(II)-responsive transcriptional regulator of zntA [Sphingobacterium siyangense]
MKLISQLAREANIPIGTIRFYEKSGLISGKTKKDITSNNYVYYDDEVIEKLRFIKMAKAVGFTLAEIKQVIDAWYQKELTQTSKMEVLDLKLEQIDAKIRELKVMKKQIEQCKSNIQNGLSR